MSHLRQMGESVLLGDDIPRAMSGSGKRIYESMIRRLFLASTQYDRVTSFYSPQSLVILLQELSEIWRVGGTARIVIGFHERMDILPALKTDLEVRNAIKKAVSEAMIGSIQSLLKIIKIKDQSYVQILRELLDRRAIHVKLVTPRANLDFYRRNSEWPKKARATFHSKFMIFHHKSKNDSSLISRISRRLYRWRKQHFYQPSTQRLIRGENFSVVTTSMNESVRAYGINIEDAVLHRSWKKSERNVANYFLDRFEHLWMDNCDDTVTMPFTGEFERVLEAIEQESKSSYLSWGIFQKIIRQSPLYHGISFEKVRLLPHQLGVYSEGLSRWPIRILLADEVGLGKTIEAGSIIDYLIRFGNADRVLILTPASLRKQWQSELDNLFGMEFWIYDPSRGVLERDGKELEVGKDLIDNSQGIKKIIVSWHWARIGADQEEPRINTDSMPDLIVVDEAHHARIHENSSGDYHTQLHKLLKRIQTKTPHILLLSATPFQTEVLDYFSLLDILGVPERFRSELERYCQWSLGNIINRRATQVQHLRSLHKYTIAYNLRRYKTLFKNGNDSIQDTKFYEDLLDTMGDLDRELVMEGHPATFMAVRNYRMSLKELGYSFPESNVNSPEIAINEDQREIFELIEKHIREFLGLPERLRNSGGQIGLMRSMYRQRIVSSIQAAYDTLYNRKEKLEKFIAEHDPSLLEDKIEEFSLNNSDIGNCDPSLNYTTSDEMVQLAMTQKASIEMANVRRMLARIRIEFFRDEVIDDPKMATLRTSIMEHLALDRKILIFSRFTSTTAAIIDSLKSIIDSHGLGRFDGSHCGVYHADDEILEFEGCTREDIVAYLKSGEIKVLVCSDAASEGLNIHYANVAINVDVPWNPSRVLQRFGRVDRLGQKSSNVYLANLYYPNSIEERMYRVLEDRRTDFRAVLGEIPEIMSEQQKEVINALGTGSKPRINLTLESIELKRKEYQQSRIFVGKSTTEDRRLMIDHLYDSLIKILKSKPSLHNENKFGSTQHETFAKSFDPFDESFIGIAYAQLSPFEEPIKEDGVPATVHYLVSSSGPLCMVLAHKSKLIPLPSQSWVPVFSFIFLGIPIDISDLSSFRIDEIEQVWKYVMEAESWLRQDHNRMQTISNIKPEKPVVRSVKLGPSLGTVLLKRDGAGTT